MSAIAAMLLLLCQFFISCFSLTKVVVPAIYKEYEGTALPEWVTSDEVKAKYGYDTFLYQRLDPNAPHFVRNRGTEGAVFLKYIVDHYDNLPDIAIFLHGRPEDHQPHWLEYVGCLKPTATYMNINFLYLYRTILRWPSLAIWMEQCWRDVLKIAWNVTTIQLEDQVPVNKPILVSLSCCQQFVISREMIRKRPLSVWKEFLRIMNEQDVCHEGEPEYEHLYSYLYESAKKVGPEPRDVLNFTDGARVVKGDKAHEGFGRYIQGLTMEHLSHVIFGHLDPDMAFPTEEELCAHFEPNTSPACPHSPCKIPPQTHHFHRRLRHGDFNLSTTDSQGERA